MINQTTNNENKTTQLNRLKEIQSNLSQYICHIVRSVYQRRQFHADVKNLKPGETVLVVDYMMKLLFRKLYEPQSDWFGKKGVSLHGAMFLFKESADGPLITECHDYYSEDDTQNWFFSACCIEESTKNFKKLHPDVITMKIWSDNGPHYKNTSLVLWLSNMKELANIELTDCNNFEPQEGKTKLDSHYATLKFALKSYVKERHDLTSADDIKKGASGRLKGTHVYEVTINRSEEPPSASTWGGISNFFSFSYSYDAEGKFAGLASQEQRGFGKTSKLSSAQMNKFWKGKSACGTGVSSKFEVSEAADIAVLPEKNRQPLKLTASATTTLTKETESEQPEMESTKVSQCPDCNKYFLRPGNLDRHRASCKRRKDEQSESTAINSSIKRAKQMQDMQLEKERSSSDGDTELQNMWIKQLKGSALKSQQPRKPSIRFNQHQINIMVQCYNEGKNKGKRFTPQQSQAAMRNCDSLSSNEVLSESQIRSFWSRHHKNQKK